MPKFRKKPVVIDAIQYTGDNIQDVATWAHGKIKVRTNVENKESVLIIYTLEGMMIVRPNDWVICGVNGEYYPCKPDIFDKTYEPVIVIGASDVDIQ